MALLRPDASIACLWGFQPGQEETEVVTAVEAAVISLRAYGSRECAYERVGYMPMDGGKGAFTFGHVDGLLRGALLMAGIRPRYVTPMLWQAAMECLTGGDKNVSKRRAIELYPNEKITHGVADALLIARYGWNRLAL